MKPTLLFAMLSLVFAVPQATAMTELETLRAKCIEQERQIRRLEEQVDKLKPAASPAALAATGKSSQISNASGKAAAAEGTTYKVRAGDSLEKIARKAGCSPTKLAKANGIKTSTMIHPGQTLKLPGTAIAQTATPQATPAAHATKETTTASVSSSYTIKQGETYASISRRTKISVDSLIAANPSIKPTALRPGQVIRLSPAAASAPQPRAVAPIAKAPTTSHTTVVSTPVKQAPAPEHTTVASQPAATGPQPTANPTAATSETKTPASEQEPKASPSNPEKKIRSVTIEGEMTYGAFANQHGTDTNRLNDLNGLDLTQATVLAKGSELYVPAQP